MMQRLMSFTNLGVMCINGEIQGVCQKCIWLEWNPELKECTNFNTCLCPQRDDEQPLVLGFSPLPASG